MTIINIDFCKIEKARLKAGKRKDGKPFAFGELVLIPFNAGPREENGITKHGIVKQGVTKEEREAGVEMPILGDFRIIGGSSSRPAGEHSSRPLPTRPQRQAPPPPADDGSEIP